MLWIYTSCPVPLISRLPFDIVAAIYIVAAHDILHKLAVLLRARCETRISLIDGFMNKGQNSRALFNVLELGFFCINLYLIEKIP